MSQINQCVCFLNNEVRHTFTCEFSISHHHWATIS